MVRAGGEASGGWRSWLEDEEQMGCLGDRVTCCLYSGEVQFAPG